MAYKRKGPQERAPIKALSAEVAMTHCEAALCCRVYDLPRNLKRVSVTSKLQVS